MFKAIAFDLDGVITDTANYHYLAWKALGDDLGIPFDRQFNEQLKGISRMASLEKILELGKRTADFSNEQKLALAAKKNTHYLTLIKTISPADILPGISSLLNELKEANIQMVIASASKNAPTILAGLGIQDYFDAIIDPDSLTSGKPDPEIFSQSAQVLGLTPNELIGIEDSEAGIQSINAANMFSVGVGEATSMKLADSRVDSTAELTLDFLKQVFI
ncbi:beta-phosphoglucomutase [Vagococcus sp. BWB3-3]|uniref:Beta-phosphoglucomutase n=1 Tax=Vagococcus allomyrinae TaxID=2794353 RepID=A0A940P7D9_9ENTE|nr:beta-phosphoglucomutase [Vagococcus allomyrinae]MBP1042757.1 beta-phosphoglucomutase [Vagococcus allomyrinae]